MNRTYTLHDDTAKRLYGASMYCAVAFRLFGFREAADKIEAAAGTLAAQNPVLTE